MSQLMDNIYRTKLPINKFYFQDSIEYQDFMSSEKKRRCNHKLLGTTIHI